MINRTIFFGIGALLIAGIGLFAWSGSTADAESGVTPIDVDLTMQKAQYQR